ncbi:MAG: hypothetical protein PVF43_12430 [Candidatus Eiseniibacteriota bacterium]|jgi:hypothetical protein
MIEVTEAIDKALELFRAVFKDAAGDREIVELQVEEAEFSDDPPCWSITVGYSRRGEVNPGTLGEALGQIKPKLVRRYKVFRIDADCGRVLSMQTGTPRTL